MLLALEDDLYIGTEKQVGTTSMEHANLSVMFVDDGESGYFYAIDTAKESPIVDSLFVYNVNSVEERQLLRKLEICWAKNGKMALLFINDYPHAVFDFERLVGYNHSKFPEPDISTMWSHEEVTQDLVKDWLKL
ncbi:hypothetical protein EDC44_1136 [Cricetibacter osteomyelitidis]|uniref:DUF2251 domain-containing protein n=1 Tax=Cricetibacter osteomyelitidis TaxID=1521931 RepID=A0A4R2T0P6_9PAST|nr:DUF2251 domain-containing protein [Cricetibacter osteomyelitidis]TCP94861.1 hypothetical protein EDC44_1136 [Cricetibacter osteomyelitidis]